MKNRRIKKAVIKLILNEFFSFFYHFQDEKRNSSVVESEGSSEGITSTEGLLDQKIIAEKQNLEKGSKHLPRQTWGRKVTEIFAL